VNLKIDSPLKQFKAFFFLIEYRKWVIRKIQPTLDPKERVKNPKTEKG
jgi:hypothetical protein